MLFGGALDPDRSECRAWRRCELGMPHAHTCDQPVGHATRYGHHCPLCDKWWLLPTELVHPIPGMDLVGSAG